MKIIPKLLLKFKTDTEFDGYVRDKVSKINQSPGLAAVVPSTAVVEAQRDVFYKALVKADQGTLADTEYKNEKRRQLHTLVTKQAYSCADIADGNLALYETSGYEAKDVKGSAPHDMKIVTGLHLAYGDNDGEIKAGWHTITKAGNLTVEVYTDANNPSASLIQTFLVPKIGRKMTVLRGLPSGQKVLVRVRANGGKNGHGPWSDPAMIRVP
jgi:hypothetical protein